MAIPNPAPTMLPNAPMAIAWVRYAKKTCPAVAPRQRRMAMVPSFCRMKRWVALATPSPPNNSATNATRPR